MAPPLTTIFVYGTLKAGQCRASLWPCTPLRVESAVIMAALYDLGPYPAIVAGSDCVIGELWRFAEADIPRTLATLDDIEGFADRPDDLYRRQTVDCQTLAGEQLPAFSYYYARSLDRVGAKRILPGSDGCCRWPTAERGQPTLNASESY